MVVLEEHHPPFMPPILPPILGMSELVGASPPQPPRILYLRDLLRLFLEECFL